MLIYLINTNSYLNRGFILNGKMVTRSVTSDSPTLSGGAQHFEDEDTEMEWRYVDVDL